MTAKDKIRRRVTNRKEGGRYSPKSYSEASRYRFARDRRRGYLRRLGGEPDERQALLIATLVDLEWNRLKCEAEAHNATGRKAYEMMRLAAEWSRQLLLLDRELARTKRHPQAPPAPPTLAEHLSRREV